MPSHADCHKRVLILKSFTDRGQPTRDPARKYDPISICIFATIVMLNEAQNTLLP